MQSGKHSDTPKPSFIQFCEYSFITYDYERHPSDIRKARKNDYLSIGVHKKAALPHEPPASKAFPAHRLTADKSLQQRSLKCAAQNQNMFYLFTEKNFH